MKKPTCETCVYWEKLQAEYCLYKPSDNNGKCIIECPITFIDNIGWSFPVTQNSSGCGEYINKDTLKSFLECLETEEDQK